MAIREQIKILCIKKGISVSELARRMEVTPQALSQKLIRGSVSIEELKKIAELTGCKFEAKFVLDDGDSVNI